MVRDKFNAVWVSYSSIGDYLRCPRAYYLNNIYRDAKSNHKITLMQPPLALGQVVHEVIDSLSVLPVDDRFKEPLVNNFQKKWQKISGKRGGFRSKEEEQRFKERGENMLVRLAAHPGPLLHKAVKIRQELPHYWLSDTENIILCGKIDWLEYETKTDSVRIIDFKTGKFDEDESSLQLPIYYLLAIHCQKYPVSRASYWYLDRDNEPIDNRLPDKDTAYQDVLEIAKTIALARKLEHFKCKSREGCAVCRPLEKIIRNEAERVGVNDYNQDVYVLK